MPMNLPLLSLAIAVFVYCTLSLLTARLDGDGLARAFVRSVGVYVGVALFVTLAAWIFGKFVGVDVLEQWDQRWEAGDDWVLLIVSLYGSVLPLMISLTMWRVYRSPGDIGSLEIDLEFPLNLFFDEGRDRRGLALLGVAVTALAFLPFFAVSVTSAADLVLGTTVSSVGTTILGGFETTWSFIEDTLLILGALFALTVLAYVAWEGITEDPAMLGGLAVLLGLFTGFAWLTGRLDEVADHLSGPFVRMFERFFG